MISATIDFICSVTQSETPIAHIPTWIQIIAGALFCFPLGLIFSPASYFFINSYLVVDNNYITAQRKQSFAQRRKSAEQRPNSEKEIIQQTIGLWLILGIIFSPILNMTINTPFRNLAFPPSSDSGNGEAPSSVSPSDLDSSKSKLGAVLDGSDPMSEEKLKLLCYRYTNYDPECGRLNKDGGTWNTR